MAYSYHDWASKSPIRKDDKKKSGMIPSIKRFFTRSERPAAKKKAHRSSSDPDVADNYGRQFGQGIRSSQNASSNFNPNSFFSKDGASMIPKISPTPKNKPPPNSSPAFDIPDYHKQTRPSLESIFDIKHERNIKPSNAPHSQKPSSPHSKRSESPKELLGGPSITRHHSTGSADWRTKERKERHEKRRHLLERRPSLTEASVASGISNISQRSAERSERRRGGIKVVGAAGLAQPKPNQIPPKRTKGPMHPHPDPPYMMQMPPYGIPYMQGPYEEGQANYGYPPPPVMLYPPYGSYAMPPSSYMNLFPPVPEETGTESMSHKHSEKTDKKQRRRHRSKDAHKNKPATAHENKVESPPANTDKEANIPHGFDDFALY